VVAVLDDGRADLGHLEQEASTDKADVRCGIVAVFTDKNGANP
jgi:hypothetical protein